ncbi:DUF1156 domain-containing protein [Alicyclobacillus acidocaldarius]|uniref:DUF1156 domain-containing protein n=1 Tax=Alicyclobacillus acidocaldarius TaxID=405212 RepID=UPI00192CAA4B|nr:DUF1156 domain-containing protein [Alicyclobacillus acidocaldarius]
MGREDFIEKLPHQTCRGTFASNAQGRSYGFVEFKDYFTHRQLIALSTFSDLVSEARKKVYEDARNSGMPDDGIGLEDGGSGATAYADAVAVYLALAVDKLADRLSSIASWDSSRENIRNTFSRQAIPMVWDFAEANPFSDSTGNWMAMVDWVWEAVENAPMQAIAGEAHIANAQTQTLSTGKIVSTDPPYYDNIGYADLSDFFYVWLRRSLHTVLPGLFATVAVPKDEELVATPYRHGTREEANSFFLQGMSNAMDQLVRSAHPAFPVTIYYAFKQSDTDQDGTSSIGWIAFLEALLRAGFSITGTWPLRTELTNRILGQDSNALASSIVIVCRKRSSDAEKVSRRHFLRELNTVIPDALSEMVNGGTGRSPIAAVDLQQAAIGPGMAVFSKYAAVLEADGSPMTVKTALQLINRIVDSYLHASDAEVDANTLFCINWFDQFGWSEADFGRADVLARAKGTSVDAVRAGDVLTAGHGKVRLLRWQEYPSDWRPGQEHDTPVWEALHHLIRALQLEGEQTAGELLAGMYGLSESIRSLAYRLYTLCERKGWAEEARAYNELIASWDAIAEVAQKTGLSGSQLTLDVE